MKEKNAFNLIQSYLNGWKKNDLEMIISCLDESCVVIESHGPTYHGIVEIELWFKYWLSADSRVIKWDLLSFDFCEKSKTAFIEWDFSCISNNTEYSLPGMSIIRFNQQKISFIHEYRMTHPAYDWTGNELKSY